MERRLHTRHRARTVVYITIPGGRRKLCKAVNLSATGVFIETTNLGLRKGQQVVLAFAINLGTGTGTTVRELLAAFNRVADQPVEAREAGSRPGDVAGAYTRIGRAERLLGWRPQYDIAEGIRHSLQWAALRDDVLSGESA